MKHNNVTFVIPIYQLKDYHERNFWHVVDIITSTTECKIVVIEHCVLADKKYPTDNFIKKISEYDNVIYKPYVTRNKYFSRSETINRGVKHVETEYVWINDTDCILKFAETIERIQPEWHFVQPYASIKDLTLEQTHDVFNNKNIKVDYNKHDTRQLQIFGAGSVICRVESFLKVQFDGSYRGWGLEDYDFFDRVSRKYEIHVMRDSFGIHLWHPERVVKEGKHYRSPSTNKLIVNNPEKISELNSKAKKMIIKNSGVKFKVYFVNLDQYSERWNEFYEIVQPVCEKTGTEVVRIPAVDTRDNIWKCKEFGLDLHPTGLLSEFYFSHGNGAVGCYLSHYIIWKDMITNDVSFGLALEDDANFQDVADFIESESYAEIAEEFELIQLNSRDLSKHAALHPDDQETICIGFDGTESYMLTKTGAQKMLDVTADCSHFEDIVDPIPPYLWLDFPGLTGPDRKVKTKEHFPLLQHDKLTWHRQNSIVAAADKILGLAGYPGLDESKRVKTKFEPIIGLQDTESDILHDTKGYWQMTNGEFMQFVLSTRYKNWRKDRRIIKDFKKPPADDSIIVVCVGRDEKILIPKFIEHYEYMGVTHFIYIDNQSIDSSVELFIENCNVDLRVVQTEDSYAEADFGLRWVHEELLGYCKDRWCLVVDIDELLMLRDHETLDTYIQQLESKNINATQNVLVEFYPQELGQVCGIDPFEHSCMYDSFSQSDWYYIDKAPDTSHVIKGGVRQRVFAHFPGPANNESCCLVKKSLFKYDFYNTHSVSVGMHWILPYDFFDWNTYDSWDKYKDNLRIDPELNVLVHFKFVETNLGQYFQTRVDRGQDWNDSEEYKTYIKNLPDTFYDEHVSCEYTDKQTLFNNTVDLLNI